MATRLPRLAPAAALLLRRSALRSSARRRLLCAAADGAPSGVVGDDVVWSGPRLGDADVAQYCNGCGAQFRGLVTAETRTTKHVFPGRPLGRLCPRCVDLKEGNLQAASDEVREVPPEAFVDCVEPILARAPALCVKIVDATDFDATCIAATLREVLRGSPVVLAVNKVDLMPRFDAHDLMYMRHRLEERGLRCIDAHAVSAITGAGVADLAAAVSDVAAGRNVLVCGGASVGKSTLINLLAADVSRLSDARREAEQQAAPRDAFSAALAEERRAAAGATDGDGGGGAAPARASGFSFTLREVRDEAVTGLRLTESHMPGTTLAAISIPCLGSWAHAMYDTPGIIIRHSVAYSLFPVHLMAPLMLPSPLEPRPPLALRAGESLLLEAAWMGAGDEAAMVLGRIDVTRVGGGGEAAVVYARQLASKAVRARVVATADAPAASEVPAAYLDELRASFVAEGNVRDADALGDGPVRRPLEFQPRWEALPTHLNRATGSRGVDVAFANLGWVTLYEPAGAEFAASARPVEGSQAWARPPLYEFGDGAPPLAESAPHERSYDVDAIAIALAARDEEPPADGAPLGRAAASAAASEELGSQRRASARDGIADAVFGDDERRRVREEVFGGEDDADDWLR